MCFQDWRIGRLIRTTYYFAEDHLASSLALPPRPTRVGLTISGAETNVAASGVILVKDTISGNSVIILPVDSPPTHITLATHGDLPTKGFTITTSGGTNPIWSVIEYIAPEEYLAAALESFRTQYGLKGY